MAQQEEYAHQTVDRSLTSDGLHECVASEDHFLAHRVVAIREFLLTSAQRFAEHHQGLVGGLPVSDYQ